LSISNNLWIGKVIWGTLWWKHTTHLSRHRKYFLCCTDTVYVYWKRWL